MLKTELDDIRRVIREICQRRHPTVDVAFVEQVLEIEAAAGEDEDVAMRRIRTAVDAVLNARAG